MKAINIDDLDLNRCDLSVDVRDTCTFLASVAMRSEGSLEFEGVGSGLAERFDYLAQMCDQLGLSPIPLSAHFEGSKAEPLLLGDFLRLMSRACREGVIEAAHLNMIEDLHALERGLNLEEDKRGDAALDLGSFVDALEESPLFVSLFVDPLRAELVHVDGELWGETSEVLIDHGREGMSEETGMWVVRKHLGDDLEASDEELRRAVRVCLQDLDPVCAPEDYTMLSYIDAALAGVEDEGLRGQMKEIVDQPENVHRMQAAFDGAGLGDEGRALLRSSMELFAREWLVGKGIAWRR